MEPADQKDERKNREPFEPPEIAAKHIGVTRRRLLELARRGIRGAYPLVPNRERRSWVFRISELDDAITEGYKIASGSPR